MTINTLKTRDGQTVEHPVDWKTIADDWQQIDASVQEQYLEKSDE